MNELQALLRSLRECEIQVWEEDGKLRFRAPPGRMTPEIGDRLRAAKEELLVYLRQSQGAAADALPAPSRVDRAGPLPLSPMQRRLLFIEEMNPGSGVYHLPVGLRLRGALDVAALGRALSDLIDRHEALRMRFERVEGDHVLKIRPPSAQSGEAFALATATVTVTEAELQAAAAAEIAQPFDLETGPLLRATLFRVVPAERADASPGDAVYALLIVMHHIVSDGWSTEIVLRELGALYRAATQGTQADLPALDRQYVDFADWYGRLADDGALKAQEDYWRARLQGAATVLELPTDYARPAVQSLDGATYDFEVPDRLRGRLLDFCRSRSATPYTVLLAAFNAWLMRRTEQADIAVGMVAANRRIEFQHAVGMFMNTLVLRTQVEAADSFDAVLDRVREGVLGAQEHQQLSFERLVDIALPTRSLSHSPLFQVMMMYQDGSASAPDFGAVNAMPWALPNAYSKYDLTLSFMDGPSGMRGGFEYATALFDAASVRRMSEEFLRLLSALVDAPGRAVGGHALLGEDEIARMLGEWNATESDYAATPIHLQVQAQAALTPSAIALIDGAVEWNYAQLWQRVERVSAHLSATGALPGERIGVFMDRCADMVVAMLAVMRCGAAYVPLDPAYPRERIGYVCEDAGLGRVLVQSFLAHELPDRRLQAIAVDTLLDPANASADEDAASSDTVAAMPTVGADYAAYMIYTSGSTGRPKGVSLSHRNAANFFAALDRRDVAGGVAAGEVPCWLAVTSISFDISVLELLWTLARGHKVVLQPATPPAALLPMLAEATNRAGARAQIDFSLFYFASDADAADNEKYRLLLEGARFADCEGFEAVWVPERHFHAFGGQFPNPSVAAAAIAAITERVKIRAGSVVLPLHDPLRVAEEWSMVDNLSDGRAGIAFASGWHFGDFVFFPENYEQRHRIMREGIDTVRALWRGETVVRRGGTGKDAELGTRPRPLQPELPVWITAAASPETFRYAGEIGANVLTHLLGQSLEELREKIEIYRAARAEHGHDPATGRVTLMIHTFVGDDPETVRAHVEQPFKQYLRSSIGLLRPVAESQGLNLEVDMESVVDAGFERYFSTSALFGTPETCLDIATRIHALGVDEMACLIDFGVEIEAAIAGLDALARLKAMTQARSARVRHFARHADGGARDSSALDLSTPDLSMLDLIRRHGVTHLQSTPTFAGLLLDQIEASGETPALRRWLIGGEALPPRLAARIRERLPVRLLNMYGPTETTVWSANDVVDSDSITLGRPLANTRLYVLDPRGLPAPVGVPGELFIAGDGVAQGYWRRPDLTAERFLPDPFSPQPGRRMYRTGDIVRYRDDGRLQFVGRNDGQVKLRGFRIELGEIEAHLRSQPGVREAAVRVVADAGREPRLLAYVASARAQPSSNADFSADSSADIAVEDPRWPVARFAFPDGTAIFHSDERQLGALYKEVFEDRMYLRHGIVLEDHACVFDVGANVGSFSVFVQRNCRSPVVHSFEPIPPTFAALRRNAAWHGIDGKVHNCGLSDREEVQPFTYYPQMSGLSGRFANAEEEIRAARSVVIDQLRREGADAAMSDEEIGEWLAESFRSQTFECRLRTLSDVIREEGIAQIDLLKIDVEKSECLVLGGIADTDWPKIQQIAIEVDGAENLRRVREVLDARGFRYVVEDFVNVEAGEGVERFDVYMLYARRERIARPLPRAQDRPQRTEQTAADQGLCTDRLRMALKTALPEYMVPDAIYVLDALPRTPNGKLDAAALPTEAPRASAMQAVSPRSDQERTIAEIWQRVLGRSVASIHDNFFESGGNSLLVARVRAELQKVFGRNVSVVELFRYPTIASLADFFGRSDDAPRPSAAEASADRGAQRRQRIVRRGRGAADARATESEPEGVA